MSSYPELSPEVLSLCQSLPVKPNPVQLVGRRVTLLPLDMSRDSEVLFSITNGQPINVGENILGPYDEDLYIWRFFAAGPFKDLTDFRAYLTSLLTSDLIMPLVVFDNSSHQQVGLSCLIGSNPQHLKLELGHIWYSPIAQGRGFNLEACFLMMDHAFKLGYRRLEWKCHSLNRKSCEAAARLGFTYEATLVNHMISKEANRDTIWFRVLDCEWTILREQLEQTMEQSYLANNR